MLTNLLHTLFLLPLCKLTLSLSFLQTRQGNLDGIHLVDKPTFLKCKILLPILRQNLQYELKIVYINTGDFLSCQIALISHLSQKLFFFAKSQKSISSKHTLSFFQISHLETLFCSRQLHKRNLRRACKGQPVFANSRRIPCTSIFVQYNKELGSIFVCTILFIKVTFLNEEKMAKHISYLIS